MWYIMPVQVLFVSEMLLKRFCDITHHSTNKLLKRGYHYHSICLSTVTSWYNGVVTVTVRCCLPGASTSLHHVATSCSMTQVALVQEVCSKFTIVQYSELTMLFIKLRRQYLPPFFLPLSLPSQHHSGTSSTSISE